MEVTFPEISGIADVEFCMVGAGPAGLTCALSLAAIGRKVFLAEGGGEDYSGGSQALYEGEVIGDTYFALDACRLRYFGGTSNHWNGWCRHLDDVDFRGKGIRRIGRWPISKSDLDPYYDQAASILEIPSSSKDVELEDSGLKLISFSFSPPVRFKEKYLEEVRRNRNVFLCLDCSFLNFEYANGSVQAVVLAGPSGVIAKLGAKTFVLCAGGIENSRLLAWSNILANGDLLRGSAQHLGVYWTEHPHFSIGDALVTTEWNFNSGQLGTQFFAPTDQFMKQNGTFNCGLRLSVNIDLSDAKRLASELVSVAPNLTDWVCTKFRSGKLCATKLRAAWEQEPRAENRVVLSSKKDRLGVPKVRLYWKKNSRDLLTVKRTAEALGWYLARNDLGRLRLNAWVLNDGEWPKDDELAGNHHMGGTRMGSAPSDAVVDSNLKLFHCSNAYVLGSSVFPSGGHANPTLTIVQLALRLAKYLGSGRGG